MLSQSNIYMCLLARQTAVVHQGWYDRYRQYQSEGHAIDLAFQ